MNNLQQLEKELWEAADQLRANSRLTAAEYSMPVLGLIFLRHADNRYRAVLEQALRRIPRRDGKPLRSPRQEDFIGQAAIFLPESARYDYLAGLARGHNVGQAIDDAMQAIEEAYPILKGALPRGYAAFEPDLLAELLKIFNRESLKRATGDVFGRIYEYFLNKFAQSGAQEGGEFFTPPSLVRMIVSVIEPDHGIVLDPACGSAGMFVQTGHFIETVRHQNPNDRVTFFGQEKSDTNTKLARMNLVVHGLDGRILQGNTFYEDQHNLLGQCDFVMANPPFNVDSVDAKRVESQVGIKGRLPFGLPGVNAKSGAISNANSLWIQYFYSYLNDGGRAGFVMASSASDAANKDRDIRQKLVESGHVDVMIAIGPKFFYTRSLPCTLWFFDKGKPEDLLDTALMIDARAVYHVVSARSHVFTDEQLANLSAIVWLYRGEQEKFVELMVKYQRAVVGWLEQAPERLQNDSATVGELEALLTAFAEQVTLAALNREQSESKHVTAAQLEAFRAELGAAVAKSRTIAGRLDELLGQAFGVRGKFAAASLDKQASGVALQAVFDDFMPLLKAAQKDLETRHKLWLQLLDTGEKTLRARQWDGFEGKRARELRRSLTIADPRREEETTPRDLALEAIHQAVYFIQQGHWLQHRFPDGLYEDVAGLCKIVTRAEIAANDYSLTPGRYVGVAPPDEDDEEDFKERLTEIHAELEELNEKAGVLAGRIQSNFEELME